MAGSRSIQIFVKTPSPGKTITIDFDTSNTVGALKEEIFNRTKIPVKEQRVIWAGKQLDEDNRTLSDYNISSESNCSMILRFMSDPLRDSYTTIATQTKALLPQLKTTEFGRYIYINFKIFYDAMDVDTATPLETLIIVRAHFNEIIEKVNSGTLTTIEQFQASEAKLKEKLIGKPPMSSKMKAAVGLLIGALTGAIIAFTGGAALIPAVAAIGVGSIIGTTASLFFPARQRHANYVTMYQQTLGVQSDTVQAVFRNQNIKLLIQKKKPSQDEIFTSLMKEKADEIIPGLFLANQTAGNAWLQEIREAHLSNRRIVKIDSFINPNIHDGLDRSHFLNLEFGDTSTYDLLPHIEAAYNFIEEGLRQQHTILVHCNAGSSRSPVIMIGYLMKRFNLSLEEAEAHVVNKRHCVNIEQWRGQLQQYEARLNSERQEAKRPSV